MPLHPPRIPLRPRMTPRRVALILDLHNHIHRGVLQGLCAFVRGAGPWDFVWVQQNSALPWPEWAELAPHGVIAHAPTPELMERLAAVPAGVAVVSLGDSGGTTARPAVQKDHGAVGRMGAEHFLERGFRSLAFCGHAALGYGREMAAGFVTEAAQAGVDATVIELKFPLRPDWHWEEVRAELEAWLRALPSPVAVMACNDYFARQLLLAAEALGLAVPEELALLGVNDNPIECQLSHVPLSSVEVAAETIGWEAGRVLERLMGGEAADAAVVRVPPVRVVVRQSSDVFAIDDPVVAAAVRFLHHHAKEAIGVDDLVRGSGLSRRRFEMRFREALGRSPYHELIRARVALARDLLAQTSLKLGAIAEECGFGEMKHLHRHFRRHVGMTPAAFRQQVWRRSGRLR